MYRAEDIQARLHERPFRPFRIIVNEGLRFEIRHPDLVFVGSRDLMIGFPGPDNPSLYDRVTRVAILHVVALEDMEAAPKASDNGP